MFELNLPKYFISVSNANLVIPNFDSKINGHKNIDRTEPSICSPVTIIAWAFFQRESTSSNHTFTKRVESKQLPNSWRVVGSAVSNLELGVLVLKDSTRSARSCLVFVVNNYSMSEGTHFGSSCRKSSLCRCFSCGFEYLVVHANMSLEESVYEEYILPCW